MSHRNFTEPRPELPARLSKGSAALLHSVTQRCPGLSVGVSFASCPDLVWLLNSYNTLPQRWLHLSTTRLIWDGNSLCRWGKQGFQGRRHCGNRRCCHQSMATWHQQAATYNLVVAGGIETTSSYSKSPGSCHVSCLRISTVCWQYRSYDTHLIPCSRAQWSTYAAMLQF